MLQTGTGSPRLFADRINQLRALVTAQGGDAVLVTEPHNVFYLTGFTGCLSGASAWLIVVSDEAVLLVDYRYLEEAEAVVKAAGVRGIERSRRSETAAVLKSRNVKNCLFESHHMTVQVFERLRDELEGVDLLPSPGLVERMRKLKHESEVARIREAAALADKAFDHILTKLRPGMTEAEVAFDLEIFMRGHGARGISFDIIVAAGTHSAVPHASTGNTRLESGDLLKMDFGAELEGYRSDMTRTVVLGNADRKQQQIYQLVLDVQERVLLSLRPGAKCRDLYLYAKDCFDKEGYASHFTHNLGHGVGLQVHEAPTLGAVSREELERGMVFTIEPGLYLPGWGGVRIEDMVYMSSDGPEILTGSPKDLIEVRN